MKPPDMRADNGRNWFKFKSAGAGTAAPDEYLMYCSDTNSPKPLAPQHFVYRIPIVSKPLYITLMLVVLAFGLISAVAGWIFHPILYMSGLMSIVPLVILDRLRTNKKIPRSLFFVQSILFTLSLPFAF